MKTIFEKIIDGDLPSEKIYEDRDLLVIKDKYPKAPVHLLIIPKKAIPNIQSFENEDFPFFEKIFRVVQKLAVDFALVEDGYRVLVNNGPDAGQVIPHVHFHLLGGRALGDIG